MGFKFLPYGKLRAVLEKNWADYEQLLRAVTIYLKIQGFIGGMEPLLYFLISLQ